MKKGFYILISRRVSVLLLFIALGVGGYIAIGSLPREGMPDVVSQQLVIRLFPKNIGSPQEVDALYVTPLERRLGDLEFLKSMRLYIRNTRVAIRLEFEEKADIEERKRYVQGIVDGVVKMDREPVVEIPSFVNEGSVKLVLYKGKRELLQQTALMLQGKIESVSGVKSVSSYGFAPQIVRILVTPETLRTYNLQESHFARAIASGKGRSSAGSVKLGSQKWPVVIAQEIKTLEDIRSLPLLEHGDGTVLTISQVAEVEKVRQELERYSRYNGHSSVILEANFMPGSNVVETSDAVRQAIRDVIASQEQAGVAVVFLEDRGQEIKELLRNLQNTVLFSTILLVMFLTLLLGYKEALLVSLCIPGSFLTAFVALHFLGMTLNFVSLFALIFVVGMLVDASIIMVENAFYRIKGGLTSKAAFVDSCYTLSIPIMTSTATTVLAFLPLLFFPGIMGQMMKVLPITVCVALIGSLVMALFFLPAIGTFFLRTPSTREENPIEENDAQLWGKWTRAYAQFLEGILRSPLRIGLVITGVVIFVAGAVFLLPGLNNKLQMSEEFDDTRGMLFIVNESHYSLETMRTLITEIENIVLEQPFIKSLSSSLDEGTCRMRLIYKESLKKEAAEVMDMLSRKLDEEYEGLRIVDSWRDLREGGGGRDVGGRYVDIEVVLRSEHKELMAAIAEKIQQYMEKEGFKNPSLSSEDNSLQWVLTLKKQEMLRYGVLESDIANAIKKNTSGVIVGKFIPVDTLEETDILLVFEGENEQGSNIETLLLRTPKGDIPLSHFLTKSPDRGKGVIVRRNKEMSISVEATVLKSGFEATRKKLHQWIKAENFSPVVSIGQGKREREMEESKAFVGKAFIIALLLIFVVLMAQFNSLSQVLIIMTSVVLSTAFTVYILYFKENVEVITAGVGLLAFAGIIVNNNIVLVDTYNRLRKSDKIEAIKLAVARRMRPILLTALTTSLGFLPLVLQIQVDFLALSVRRAEETFATVLWTSASSVLCFGLLFATILSLLATPCLLAFAYYLEQRVGQFFYKMKATLLSKK